MIVSDFFIWRAWANSLTHYSGNIEGSALGLGIAATVAASATTVLGVCILHRIISLQVNRAPHAFLLRTAMTAIIAVGGATVASIILGG